METSTSEIWQRRFQFYAENGSPFSKSGLDAYKKLSFGDRMAIGFNVWAFLFGILYYFYLGITKRGVGIALVSFVLFVLLIHNDASPTLIKALGIATQATFGSLANYYYFIKATQGRDEWDPLKDVR